MIIVILSVAALLGLGIAYLNLKGENKSHYERSSTETIAVTAVNAVKKEVKDFSKSIRTPESIQTELLHKLDNVEQDLRNRTTSALVQLEKAHNINKNLYDSSVKRIVNLENLMRYYRDSKQDGYLRETAAQLVIAKKLKAKAEKQIGEFQIKMADFENDFSNISLLIQSKKADVLTMDFMSSNNSIKIADDLMAELNERIAERNIQNKVSNIINNSQPLNTTEEANENEILEAINNLDNN